MTISLVESLVGFDMDVTHLDGHKVGKPVSLLPLEAFSGWLEVISAEPWGLLSPSLVCYLSSLYWERLAVTVPQMFPQLRVDCTAFGGLVLTVATDESLSLFVVYVFRFSFSLESFLSLWLAVSS